MLMRNEAKPCGNGLFCLRWHILSMSLTLLFASSTNGDNMQILVTQQPCDFPKDKQIYASGDGDLSKYMLCGQTRTFWLFPCQPGTVFSVQLSACVPNVESSAPAEHYSASVDPIISNSKLGSNTVIQYAVQANGNSVANKPSPLYLSWLPRPTQSTNVQQTSSRMAVSATANNNNYNASAIAEADAETRAKDSASEAKMQRLAKAGRTLKEATPSVIRNGKIQNGSEKQPKSSESSKYSRNSASAATRMPANVRRTPDPSHRTTAALSPSAVAPKAAAMSQATSAQQAAQQPNMLSPAMQQMLANYYMLHQQQQQSPTALAFSRVRVPANAQNAVFANENGSNDQANKNNNNNRANPIITKLPVEVKEQCEEGGPCDHNTEANMFCPHTTDKVKYFQCSPSGWMERSCPGSLHFAGDHCDSAGSAASIKVHKGLVNNGTPGVDGVQPTFVYINYPFPNGQTTGGNNSPYFPAFFAQMGSQPVQTMHPGAIANNPEGATAPRHTRVQQQQVLNEAAANRQTGFIHQPAKVRDNAAAFTASNATGSGWQTVRTVTRQTNVNNTETSLPQPKNKNTHGLEGTAASTQQAQLQRYNANENNQNAAAEATVRQDAASSLTAAALASQYMQQLQQLHQQLQTQFATNGQTKNEQQQQQQAMLLAAQTRMSLGNPQSHAYNNRSPLEAANLHAYNSYPFRTIAMMPADFPVAPALAAENRTDGLTSRQQEYLLTSNPTGHQDKSATASRQELLNVHAGMPWWKGNSASAELAVLAANAQHKVYTNNNEQQSLKQTPTTAASSSDLLETAVISPGPSGLTFYQPAEGTRCSLLASPKAQVWPDASDVRTFFICLPPQQLFFRAEATDGVWVKMRCPDDMLFNSRLKVCDKS